MHANLFFKFFIRICSSQQFCTSDSSSTLQNTTVVQKSTKLKQTFQKVFLLGNIISRYLVFLEKEHSHDIIHKIQFIFIHQVKMVKNSSKMQDIIGIN